MHFVYWNCLFCTRTYGCFILTGEPNKPTIVLPGIYVPLVDRESFFGTTTTLRSQTFSHYGRDYKLTFQAMKLGTGHIKVCTWFKPNEVKHFL